MNRIQAYIYLMCLNIQAKSGNIVAQTKLNQYKYLGFIRNIE